MGIWPKSLPVIAALLTCIASPSPATDYFVSTTGNNANTGRSAANAFATIQHAVNLVQPGDTVRVLPGSYQGCRIERSGRPGLPIRLVSEIPRKAKLVSVGPSNRRNSVLEVETYNGSGVISNFVVEGLYVSGSPRYGIDARSCLDITLRGNLVSNSVSTGIFAPFAYGLLVESNESSYNGEHGIYVNNSSDRFTVRENTLHHNRYSGVHLNGDYSVRPPDGTPWQYDGVMSGGLVEANTIYSNGTGGAAINMDGVDTTIVRNNLIYESPNNSGIAIFWQDGRAPSRQNLIAHNSIVMSTAGGWAINVANTGCVSNRILNNCAYSLHSFRGSIVLAAAQIQGLVCNYNAIEPWCSIDGGGTRINFSTWQARGHDANSVSASPSQLYVNRPRGDFHLRPDSPAIDRGTPAAVTAADADGTPRPLDGNADGTAQFDMGAFELINPAADSDRDRMTDADELTAGTDPRDPASLLRLHIRPGDAGAPPGLSWPSAAGRDYAISGAQRMGLDLAEVTNGLAATPPSNLWAVATSASSGVYRVSVRKR